MGESEYHIKLVKKMLNNLPDFITKETKAFISVDIPESKNKPKLIFSEYKPDIYLEHDGLLFIGEAKTRNDVFSKHSKAQYICCLDYCNAHENAYFSVIVPWDFLRGIKNYFRTLKIKHNLKVNIIIYDDIGNKVLL